MRKRIASLALAVIIVLALCVPAMADAPTQPGFYLKEGAVSGIEITGMTASRSTITAVYSRPAGTNGAFRKFFPGSEQLKVSLSSTDSAKQYLVILVKGSDGNVLPKQDNLAYIDQMGNGTSLDFYVYPNTLSADTDLMLWITNSDQVVAKIPLGYWSRTSYEEQAFVRGDANMNGDVESSDATVVLRHSVGLVNLTGSAFSAADANQDGQVDTSDATAILRKSVGYDWGK